MALDQGLPNPRPNVGSSSTIVRSVRAVLDMLTPDSAAQLTAAHAPRLPVAPVALRDASGCVLRQEVVAERDQPPFDRVAMDGIAISSNSNAREFRIAGTQAAGAPPLTLADPADCIEA